MLTHNCVHHFRGVSGVAAALRKKLVPGAAVADGARVVRRHAEELYGLLRDHPYSPALRRLRDRAPRRRTTSRPSGSPASRSSGWCRRATRTACSTGGALAEGGWRQPAGLVGVRRPPRGRRPGRRPGSTGPSSSPTATSAGACAGSRGRRRSPSGGARSRERSERPGCAACRSPRVAAPEDALPRRRAPPRRRRAACCGRAPSITSTSPPGQRVGDRRVDQRVGAGDDGQVRDRRRRRGWRRMRRSTRLLRVQVAPAVDAEPGGAGARRAKGVAREMVWTTRGSSRLEREVAGDDAAQAVADEVEARARRDLARRARRAARRWPATPGPGK